MEVYRVAPLGGTARCHVEVPGSKSVANRALVCAALADGQSTLRGAPEGDDTEAMLDCLRVLGLEVERDFDMVQVGGGRSLFKPGPLTLPTGWPAPRRASSRHSPRSGPGRTPSTGSPPLRAGRWPRCTTRWPRWAPWCSRWRRWGHLPVTVHGPIDVTLDEVQLRGDISSQYLTALMLIAPYFPNGLRFMLTTPLVSRPYIRITAAVMALRRAGCGARRSHHHGARWPLPALARDHHRTRRQLGQLPARCGGHLRWPGAVPGLTIARCRAMRRSATCWPDGLRRSPRTSSGTTVSRARRPQRRLHQHGRPQ
jgi:hypothetical protein